MRLFRAIAVAALVSMAVTAVAGDFIPVPDFSSYEIPNSQTPEPRGAWREWLDLAALATGLALASYFALVRRSRRGLFLLSLVSLAWLGFWRKGCICPIGAIQNVTLGLFDSTYAVPLGLVALFVLPLVTTLFFGRTFCAAVCPLGAVQELVAVRPRRVPVWLDQALGLFAYVYLGAAVLFAATGTAFIICRYDPFVGLFRMSAGTEMLIVGAAFLVVGMFVGRPYCRYLCPYGALLGLASRVARWHVRIPPKECIQCRLCEDSCPYGAIREPTVPLTPRERTRGRRRLVALACLLPVLVAGGAWLGRQLEIPLALVHPTVALAEQVRLEEMGETDETNDASENFRNSGRAVADLYEEARQIAQGLGRAGAWFGAWVGLVIGGKLIHLSLRRGRSDYEPDRTACVACGRCFWYCPNEQERQGLIEKIREAPQIA